MTIVVSRGIDYGDGAEVPSVVGMAKNDALTTLGKWVDVQVEEVQNAEVPAGEVISQNPEAYSIADPDLPMTITVSTGNQAPGETQTNTSSDQNAAGVQNQAAASGEIWKCNQRLNTPSGYQGGPIRLELVQEVGGTPTASVVLEGQALQFPYQLDITGAPGVSDGTLYLWEEIDGTYQKLGQYSITFEKAE